MTEVPRLLVVGAQEGSLGAAVVAAAESEWNCHVQTAGISGQEKHFCDLTVAVQVRQLLHDVAPDYIVCTVGENAPASVRDGFLQSKMLASYHLNVVAPLLLLHHFLGSQQSTDPARHFRKKFVAISSNSARIARSGSLPYCASKAGLSMALRVAARDVAGEAHGNDMPFIWGYEPGLLAGTPMTRETEAHFWEGGDAAQGPPLHRMKGVGMRGLHPADLAQRIVMDLTYSGPGLHGSLFPYDAGEQ